MVSKINVAKKVKTILYKVLIVILSLLTLFIGLPIILATLGPTCIFRRIVFHLAKSFKPELGKMLTIFSTMHTLHSNSTIVAVLVLVGKVPIGQIRKEAEEKIIQAMCPTTGNALYPELQQRPTKWMGFYFWKQLKSFKLEDHIVLYESEEQIDLDGEIGKKFIKDFGVKLWEENKALWEIVVLPNVRSNSCSDKHRNYAALAFRWHHSLADGLSILKLCGNICDPSPAKEFLNVKKSEREGLKVNWKFRVAEVVATLWLPFKASYDFVDNIVQRGVLIKDPMKFRGKNVEGSLSYDSTDKIPLTDFKDIGAKHGVGFNGAVLTTLAGAFKEFKKDLEHDFALDVVLPLPDHPMKLRNHTCNGFIKLPVTEADPHQRLKSTQALYDELRCSFTPWVFSKVALLTGSQFPSLLKLFTPLMVKQPTIILINFLWGKRPVKIAGYPMKDFFYEAGAVTESKLMVLIFFSYAEQSKLMVQGDKGILSDQDAKNFVELFTKEIQYLKNAPVPQTV